MLILPTGASSAPGMLDVAAALRRAAAIEVRVRELGWAEKPVAFAFGHDVAAFAAALWGCWRAGCFALLPADSRRELVGPLLGPGHDGPLIHDTGVGRGIHAPSVLAESPESPPPPPPEVPLPKGPAMASIGYEALSARSGTPWNAEARPAWLEPGVAPLFGRVWTGAEVVAEAESALGELGRWAGELAIGTTLAPSAAPAVFHGLLAPLLAGRPVREATCTAPAAAPGDTAWVTSPAHRRGLPARARCLVTMHWPEADGDAAAMGPEGAGDDRALALVARCGAVAGVDDVALAAADGAWRAAAVCAPGADPAAVATNLRAVDGVVEVTLVEDLGRDPNGLLPARIVHRAFGRDAEGRPLERAFTPVENAHSDDGGRAWTVEIPALSAWYEGHFPGYPVLAGAVQLQEIVEPLVERLAQGKVVQRWQGLKFPARIVPGDRVEVGLRGDLSAGKLTFEIRRGDTLCTAGVAVLADGAAR